MSYQPTSQYLSPEKDPSQGQNAAYEILFGRAGVLSRAKRVKKASARMVMGELQAIEQAQPQKQRQVETDAVQALETAVPKAAEAPVDLTAQEEEIRKQVDSVFEELDTDDFMRFEELMK